MRQLFPTSAEVDPLRLDDEARARRQQWRLRNDACRRADQLGRTIDALGKRGHRNVLCEGGPGIAAQLAAGDLLDDVCLTISPVLTAGGARRILDGPGLASPGRFDLAHVLHADGYLFPRYRRP